MRAAHFRHDHTHPQILRNHRASRARGGVVAAGHDGGTDAVAGELGAAAGDLLCRGRDRWGTARDAHHQLDGAAGRLAGLVRVGCTGGNVKPESSTRMTRSERCRPSQAMRGSACKLVRPSGSTMPGIADAALVKPASAAMTTSSLANAARSPNG